MRLLQSLAGGTVTDDDLEPLLPRLLEAVKASPDPDRALSSFARWFAAVGSPYSHLQTLIRHPVALDLFCLVTGSSQYFADLLVRNPEYFEIIANPGVRGGTKTASRFYRDASALVDACIRPELKKDALRRWKAREMLRIGVRDLVGLADMPATTREFSNLADACVQKAHDIALITAGLKQEAHGLGVSPTPAPASPLPLFAVIGMGKLGGQELNYSSDIDLMFVHGDNLPYELSLADGKRVDTLKILNRLGEALIKVLSEESANGHVFRVDMRLRPEGRFGPLTRSLSGFAAYYESWAEGWERQSLIKARFIAGDRALGEAFHAMIEPFVYRRQNSVTFLDEVRANKHRIEEKCELEGETLLNVKTGYGGIRDVEFLVQLMQLEFGGRHPHLRTANTLSAMQRLHRAGYLTHSETEELAQDYQFLRNLEHRLQLLHGFQTQTLPPPTDALERERIARRMGFPNRAGFEAELVQRRDRVHGHLERLFYHVTSATKPILTLVSEEWEELGPLLDNLDAPGAKARLLEILRQVGLRDTSTALRALQLPMQGNEFGGMPPDTPVEFKRIAPRLFSLLQRSPDPDAGLAGMEALALAIPNRAQLYAALDDSPEMLRRLVQLGAGSPPLLKSLAAHQEWLEALFEMEEEEASSPPVHLIRISKPDEALQLASGKEKKAYESNLDLLARHYQRERLHIGARDIWEEADLALTHAALTSLTDTMLELLLELCRMYQVAHAPDPEFARHVLDRVAILGLGKLGGAELGYASDWDVLFVYDEERRQGSVIRSEERTALVNGLFERLISAVKDLAIRGVSIEMDLRLRPWGRKGTLANTLRGLCYYYRTAAETWERQAALKVRIVAGNPRVGRRALCILHAVSFGRGITPEEDAAIRAMKQRIETERLKPGERDTDLKLGHGGLSDIEWLA
ncbi:MAG TPA: hypothetical protein VKU00_13540, partial [Chthonomonadaceae bacterium]|nr:hypothetical protein [Chthonomonadaceae bacterium]